jgi:monoamine oxidase
LSAIYVAWHLCTLSVAGDEESQYLMCNVCFIILDCWGLLASGGLGRASMGSVPDTEVVVVGAGYAGLTAALHLVETGRDVTVLEARDRVGGRVWTHHVDGVPLDLGGMWVGARHSRFQALLERFGLETFPTPAEGDVGWWDERSARLRRARPMPMSMTELPSVIALLARASFLVRQTKAGPLSARRTARLDSITVADWLHRWVPQRRARATVDAALVMSYSHELAEVSLLGMARAASGEGGFLAALGTDGGTQQDLVIGGADSAARRIAGLLGSRLRLATPVREIHHDPESVCVVTDHSTVTARHVIVALPPGLTAAITWAPGLPPWRAGLLSRMPMGSVTKLVAVYERPFWRDGGWSGEVFDATGAVSSTFDISPPSGPAVLASLTCGSKSIELAGLSPHARQDRILAAMASWLGPQARHPQTVADVSWENEIFSGGGYSATPIPGSAHIATRIAEPLGRVHFAGTETASRHAGYIDGAISSGERAARDVLAQLTAGG